MIREPYVEEARLWSLMAACDACVLLRAPTMGETSGSAIRTLSLGKPLVVSDVGWFAELPDDVALKVPVGGDEEVDALAAALARLADPAVAARMGDAARAYVEREHDLDRVAGLYAAALEEAAGDAFVARRRPPRGRRGRRGHRRRAGAAGAGAARGRARLAGRTWPRGPRLGAWHRDAAPADLADVALARGAVRRLRRRPARRSVFASSSPWIMVDELVYSDMARSFAATGHFLIRGVHGELRLRLSAAALAGVRDLRLDARRLRMGARAQRAR